MSCHVTLRLYLTGTARISQVLGKSRWPVNRRPVILAPQGQTMHNDGRNARIQHFEPKNWMPAYPCGHDGQRMKAIRLPLKKFVHCLSDEIQVFTTLKERLVKVREYRSIRKGEFKL